MLQSYISNAQIKLNYKKVIDKKHIKYLLMMPKDLLKLDLPSNVFYDNLRRLFTIERFLKDKNLKRENIISQVKKTIGKELFTKLKNDKEINEKELKQIREIIKRKIKVIEELI